MTALAVHAGISVPTLGLAERAPALATERTIKLLARALAVPAEVLRGEPAPPSHPPAPARASKADGTP